ncbi:Anaphase-promoting complex subunit 3 [[Candida] zeylanoides]
MQSPDHHYLTQHLRSVVLRSLDTFNYANAEFVCERLLALDASNVASAHLYGLTLMRRGRHKACFNFLAGQPDDLGCSYLYARSCLQLAKHKEGVVRLARAAATLERDRDSAAARVNYESHRSVLPSPSAVHHLLGDLYASMGDTKNAALSYTAAVQLDQFDFEAFQKLARLGVNVRVKAMYRQGEGAAAAGTLAGTAAGGGTGGAGADVSGVLNPFSATPPNPPPRIHVDEPSSTVSTPRAALDAPLRKSSHFDANTERKSPYAKITSRFKGVKREGRPEAGAGGAGGAVGAATPPIVVQKRAEHAERYLLSLLAVFAKGYKSMCRYDCYKAIRVLESLPAHERDTPWVLSKLGRLHYEIVNYRQSEYYFVRLRAADRTRLEDMEYYSTLLWHLHKRVELTYLATELYDVDSTSAVTWCVVGNLFSLTREPDEAIRCFTRAVRADARFTYAYTLRGHEYFSNDNYELALENFRMGLLHDARHYNALYGIGMVYINLGDYPKADYHFRRAVAVNPVNVILICCVGMVLEKEGRRALALKQYELAHKLQPLNPLPIFKRAQLLFQMQQYSQSLRHFETLRDLAPDEASVHFLLGQLYKIHNDKFKAIREFTIALNLDPKGNYLIREAMESLRDT